MLVETMNWIRQNSDTVSRYTESGHLVDEPEFPPSAIREVLANALVHRALGPSVEVGKKVEVRITEKCLLWSARVVCVDYPYPSWKARS